MSFILAYLHILSVEIIKNIPGNLLDIHKKNLRDEIKWGAACEL
jgi:hypothetical protein